MPQSINSIIALEKLSPRWDLLKNILWFGLFSAIFIGFYFLADKTGYHFLIGLPLVIGAVFFYARYWISKKRVRTVDYRVKCSNSLIILSSRNDAKELDLSKPHELSCDLYYWNGAFGLEIQLICSVKQNSEELVLNIPFSDDTRGSAENRLGMIETYLMELPFVVNVYRNIRPKMGRTYYRMMHLNLPLFLPILDYWATYKENNLNKKPE